MNPSPPRRPPGRRGTGRADVAFLHAAGNEGRSPLEQPMCSCTTALPFFLFFAAVQKADAGSAAEHVARVDRAQLREVDELARVAIDVLAAVDDEDEWPAVGKPRRSQHGARLGGAQESAWPRHQPPRCCRRM